MDGSRVTCERLRVVKFTGPGSGVKTSATNSGPVLRMKWDPERGTSDSDLTRSLAINSRHKGPDNTPLTTCVLPGREGGGIVGGEDGRKGESDHMFVCSLLVTNLRLTLTVANYCHNDQLYWQLLSHARTIAASLIKQVGPLSIVRQIGINTHTIRPLTCAFVGHLFAGPTSASLMQI